MKAPRLQADSAARCPCQSGGAMCPNETNHEKAINQGSRDTKTNEYHRSLGLSLALGILVAASAGAGEAGGGLPGIPDQFVGAMPGCPFLFVECLLTFDERETVIPKANTAGLGSPRSVDGISDIELLPFRIARINEANPGYNTRFRLCAPTVRHETQRPANRGRSARAGYDSSTENNAADYRGGDVFALESALGGADVGVVTNGYYYRYFTENDRSENFESRTAGLHSAMSYIGKITGVDLAAEARWFPEIDVKHLPIKGNYIGIKYTLGF